MEANLHRIHKTLLHLVEYHDAEGHYDDHKHEAVQQPAPAHELAGTEETVLEGFQNGRHGVQAHQFVHGNAEELHTLGLGERVHDRSRVHPELDQEGEEDLEVAILGRQ